MKYRIEVRKINKMACPILLNYIVMSVFEVIDKAIVGQYSIEGFALVGIAAGIIYSITGALGILSSSFNIVAAKSKGMQEESEFESMFKVSKGLVVLIAGVFIILKFLGASWFFESVYEVHGDQLHQMLSYYYPATITVLQNMLLFQYSVYFRNELNTKIGLKVTVLSTAINILFDYSLVYGSFGMPELGVSGAAWGSVIGLSFGLLIYQVAYSKKRSQERLFQPKTKISINIQQVRQILKSYPSLLGQELLESTLFVVLISGIVSRLGIEKMAVYNLLDTVSSLLGLPVYAYATATQTFALQNHFARNQKAVHKYIKLGIVMTAALLFVLCVLCGITSSSLLRLIVADGSVIADVNSLLFIAFILVFAKIPYQIYMSYLQGVQKEKYVFLCTSVGTVVTSIGAMIVSHFIKLPGIYAAMIVEYMVLAWIYRTKANV